MKQLIMSLIFFFPLSLLADNTQIIDIDIEGMSCKFCAYSVKKNLSELPGIEQADVNIDTKKAHIVMQEGQQADIEQIKQKITESGFTPVKVTLSEQ